MLKKNNNEYIFIGRLEENKNIELLVDFFAKANLLLIDFKLEFGKHDGKIVLGDEFTPDGCRLWDKDTLTKMDKDRFRQDLGDVIETYGEVADRLGMQIKLD